MKKIIEEEKQKEEIAAAQLAENVQANLFRKFNQAKMVQNLVPIDGFMIYWLDSSGIVHMAPNNEHQALGKGLIANRLKEECKKFRTHGEYVAKFSVRYGTYFLKKDGTVEKLIRNRNGVITINEQI